jgi:CRISPR-associated endonuclease/helicase Cas3
MSSKPDFVAHTPSQKQPGQWHGLKEHLEAVAAGSEVKAEKLKAGRLGYYAGLWHDLGKYNPQFQDFLQKAHVAKLAGQKPPMPKVPHAIYGASLADELKITPLSFLIAGHHAGLPNQSDLKFRLKENQAHPDYATVKLGATREIGALVAIEKVASENLRSYFTQFTSGKVTDKVAADLFLRLIFSCLIDADRLDTEHFADPDQYQLRQDRAEAVTIAQLWNVFQTKQQEFVAGAKQPDSLVNQVRAEVLQHCLDAAAENPGVFRLCVPTGGGKTRSGLAFALKHAKEKGKDRVIFAVPYTSIIEQTVKVYRDDIFAELGDAVLEHHSATQEDEKSKTEDLESDENILTTQAQAKLATQNWDAKLIVTTTVQLFESLLSHKPKKCRKLHNIVNSVIVLDEVQTLPIGLLSPILSVLKELVDRYNVTVVLCTATQPALEGSTPYFKDGFPVDSVRDIIPEQLAVQHFKALKRVDYEIPQQGETWTWGQLVEDMASSQSALVVLNTRRDAIAVLNALAVKNGYSAEPIEPRVLESLRKSEVLHLSTLLCGKHRRVVLEEVRRRLKSGEACQLISTQVVEAGVDLDFPVVYRAMGPLDRIVQAAGRCNRNGLLKDAQGQLIPGRVVIFEPAEGSKVPSGEYSKAIQRARELLQSDNFVEAMLHQPELFEEYFRSLYPLIANEAGGLDSKGIQALRQAWSFRDVGEKFRLIEDGTTPIVIQYDEAVVARLADIARRGLWSEDHAFLQPYTISLPTRLFNRLEYKEEVKPGLDVWKWTSNYDPIRGFPLEQLDQEVQHDPLFLMM